MALPLFYGVVVLSTALLLISCFYAARNRLYDDLLLIVGAVLALALFVWAGIGLVNLGHLRTGADKATFVAYIVSLPFIPLFTGFLALKEKSRFAMGAVAVGAFAVLVMAVRVEQIWAFRG